MEIWTTELSYLPDFIPIANREISFAISSNTVKMLKFSLAVSPLGV
jgi:hypothetical protein